MNNTKRRIEIKSQAVFRSNGLSGIGERWMLGSTARLLLSDSALIQTIKTIGEKK